MTDHLPRELWLELAPGTELLRGDRPTLQASGARVRLGGSAPGLRTAMDLLAAGGGTWGQLLSLVEVDTGPSVGSWMFCVNAAARHGMLRRSVRFRGDVLLSTTSPWEASGVERQDQPVCLSRSAFLRTEDGGLVLESPLTRGVVHVESAAGEAIVAALDSPTTVTALAETTGVPREVVRLALHLLSESGLAGPPEGDHAEAAFEEAPLELVGQA